MQWSISLTRTISAHHITDSDLWIQSLPYPFLYHRIIGARYKRKNARGPHISVIEAGSVYLHQHFSLLELGDRSSSQHGVVVEWISVRWRLLEHDGFRLLWD